MTGRLPRRRTVLAPALGLVLALAASGCVALPRGGDVHVEGSSVQSESDSAPYFSPPPPRPGETPVEVLGGFLLAMQANPLSTSVARKYLTTNARTEWKPQRSTVIYGSYAVEGTDRNLRLKLSDVNRLDTRGVWLGAPAPGRAGAANAANAANAASSGADHTRHGLRYRLHLVREKGEWRIANPPDRLVIPEEYFESHFDQYSLYFFDQSAQLLVPEPVYLPRGAQTATLLTQGLLRGPGGNLDGGTRTFFPPDTTVDLSAPISASGKVEVPLSDGVRDLAPDDLQKVAVQLSWTLRQVPGVQRIRITVNGQPVTLPGGENVIGTDAGSQFDPAVVWASHELFGLRGGRVVTLAEDQESRVSGLFGSQDQHLRSISVDLPGERIAGVSDGGTQVLVSPRARTEGSTPRADDAELVYTDGTDVLKPGWDMYGQLWLVDRRRSGARVQVVERGVTREVTVPGVTGKAVNDFVISRGGTRLVAVVDAGKNPDRVVVSRVHRDENGTVRRATPARALGEIPSGSRDIRDIAWRSPTTLALLSGPEKGTARVLLASVDGSPDLGGLASAPDVFRSQAQRVVSSPAAGASLYLSTTTGLLFELSVNGRWSGTGVEQGLRSPTFVG